MSASGAISAAIFAIRYFARRRRQNDNACCQQTYVVSSAVREKVKRNLPPGWRQIAAAYSCQTREVHANVSPRLRAVRRSENGLKPSARAISVRFSHSHEAEKTRRRFVIASQSTCVWKRRNDEQSEKTTKAAAKRGKRVARETPARRRTGRAAAMQQAGTPQWYVVVAATLRAFTDQ